MATNLSVHEHGIRNATTINGASLHQRDPVANVITVGHGYNVHGYNQNTLITYENKILERVSTLFYVPTT